MSDKNDNFNNETAPLNFEQLVELYNKETALELLAMSVTESEQLINQIIDALAQKDKVTAMMQTHQLKGLAGTMTIHEMSKLCKQLEDNLKQDNWLEADSSSALLKNVFFQVQKYVTSIEK